MPPKGWHRRGYLPHYDRPGEVQHIAFGLKDTYDPATDDVEEGLDRGCGRAVLRDPVLAAIVAEALLHFDGVRYRLHAWCVTPNHVHALAQPFQGESLGAIVRSWKSFSAARINRALGEAGRVWAPDYFDRFMRDDAHYATTKAYVETNPVAAGLCARPEAWPFSSAGWKKQSV